MFSNYMENYKMKPLHSTNISVGHGDADNVLKKWIFIYVNLANHLSHQE